MLLVGIVYVNMQHTPLVQNDALEAQSKGEKNPPSVSLDLYTVCV
jgi:hypothetical protein